MAYVEKYRRQAIAYKESGHTFKELEKAFGIVSQTYYNWKRPLEQTEILQYSLPRTRKRKIDMEKLIEALRKYSDWYLSAYAERFDCTARSIFGALKKLKITVTKKALST